MEILCRCQLALDGGAKWEYGWFQGNFTLPEGATGRRIVVQLKPGGESLVWINGVVAGSIGWAHKEITVAMNGKPGEQHRVLLESYAGMARSAWGKVLCDSELSGCLSQVLPRLP